MKGSTGLQLRMTLWVAGAVLIVATIVMMAASALLHNKLEEQLRGQLEEDMNATIQVLDQHMKRVEYVALAASALMAEHIEAHGSEGLDSMVLALLSGVNCIDVASVELAEPGDSIATMYTAYNTMRGGERCAEIIPAFTERLAGDDNWTASYHHGEMLWWPHYVPERFPDMKLQCLSVPLTTDEGQRIGMVCAMILEQWLVDMVRDSKTRPDIDLSIYDDAGHCIVAPDDYISQLPPSELITEERTLERFGWRIVFAADRHIIDSRMQAANWFMVGVVALLLLCVAVAIVLAVRYVARPFVRKQEEEAAAKAAMERELHIAATTQHELVPHRFPPFPQHPEIALHACLHPAREVGGDLYDYFISDGQLYFCIGDVSGKGLPASLFMAATHYLFRSVAAAMPMADAVRQMNLSLSAENEQCTFVTFFFGRLDLATGLLEYCNAGHNPPILLTDEGAEFFAASESTPLGAWDEEEYASHSLQLQPGHTLLLYTDGVTEAKSPTNAEFGEDATLECALECGNQDSNERCKTIIDALLASVRQHAATAPQSDDITMLCLKWQP